MNKPSHTSHSSSISLDTNQNQDGVDLQGKCSKLDNSTSTWPVKLNWNDYKIGRFHSQRWMDQRECNPSLLSRPTFPFHCFPPIPFPGSDSSLYQTRVRSHSEPRRVWMKLGLKAKEFNVIMPMPMTWNYSRDHSISVLREGNTRADSDCWFLFTGKDLISRILWGIQTSEFYFMDVVFGRGVSLYPPLR